MLMSLCLPGLADDEDRDWELMPGHPMMPPPPSQPDDVEHWQRAVYYAAEGAGAATVGELAAATVDKLKVAARYYLGM